MNLDARYTIAREWCGQAEPRWIARFCGDWLGQARTWGGALRIAQAHRRAFLESVEALAVPEVRP